MKNKERFADLFNAIIFDGVQIIDAAKLYELDSAEITIIPQVSGKIVNIQKYRDIINEAIIMQDDKYTYVLLGIENQNAIHYAMPVRNMLYNAITYETQINNLIKIQKSNSSSAEFLSGVPKGTKLHPVITITLYWGDEPWDGPRTLKDMLTEYPQEADKYIDNIDINLIELVGNTIYGKCKTDLEQLLYVLSICNDTEKFRQLSHNMSYSNVSLDIANAISQYTDLKRPRNKTKGGGYNMCKAVLELEKISADKTILATIKTLMETTSQSFEWVCDKMRISPADMLRYKKML